MHEMKWALLAIAVCVLSGAAPARADVQVNTEHQMRGVAPRLEFELGPEFLIGLGHPCRPTGPALERCMSNMGLIAGRGVVLVRPFSHVAIGASVAYEARFGAQHVTVDGKQESYGLHGLRFTGELRWYSRRVAPGGFFIAFQAGVALWTDTWSRPSSSDASASQAAPLFGLEVGGVFVPYRGVGLTLGVQGRMTLFPSDAQTLSGLSESTYGYGALAFLGVGLRLAYGVGL